MAAIERQTMNKVGARLPALTRHDCKMAWIITRREVRDSFRDWRIIIPTLLLTLFFPFLMNFTAGRLLTFVGQYGADIIAERLIPFLLLVVGFFPMSFSLVIALETFVGEKERKSLEPLLATPLTNTQLYLGKILAAITPPLLAAYLGMAVYLTALAINLNWTPSFQLLLLAILLTTVQGIVMVSGAVVISSQTTSVRASNLLASFIIVPMALLIQAEAVSLFFANYSALWWIVLGMCLIAILLVRMGVQMFNREELLGRSIDHIHLKPLIQLFWRRFLGMDESGNLPSVKKWYQQTLALLPQLKKPAWSMGLAMSFAIGVGIWMANQYRFPAGVQTLLKEDYWNNNLQYLPLIAEGLPALILFQNLRVVGLQIIVGLFSVGTLGTIIFMLPWGFLSFFAAQFAMAGEDPWKFLLATVVPHAAVELPALLLIAAAAFRWHLLLISPPPHRTVSESWSEAAADFFRVLFGIAIPLLILAAFIESAITPQVLLAIYN